MKTAFRGIVCWLAALSAPTHAQVADQSEPPAPQTVTFRDGRSMTLRWEHFNNQQIRIWRDTHSIRVESALDPWHTRVDEIDPAIRRWIDYSLADAGIEMPLEEFVSRASKLPDVKDRFCTRSKPLVLVLPCGNGIDTANGKPNTIAICEVTEESRKSMFDADQKLLAFKQAVNRQNAMVNAEQARTRAAQQAADTLRQIRDKLHQKR